ncbi:hypothetical protein [Paraliobacillus ryukyuensis]|uniref:hypothetical protein n=1 Tax=Paraliobacillus ryukyuensis TaxID=200904 RepID=UPI0009A67452|nr:hypothetical protein [Paraliobacillus ryukyuensis]
MKKITMMDNITLYVNKNEYKIEIDQKFTHVSNIDEIEDLEESKPGFFDVETISRKNNKIYLVYELPTGYRSLEYAKNYLPVIKLQVMKSLLDKDPLFESNGMTYLDLNNVFFKDFKDVKVLYRANEYLPYHKGMSELEQYKLFVLGFYSNKHSYKRFLVNKDNLLKKENCEFMFSVNATTSTTDLKSLIQNELEKEQSKFYQKVQFQETSKKKGKKRKIYLSLISFFLLALLFVGGMKQMEKSVALDFREELKIAETENELVLAISSGDTEKATDMMKKNGRSDKEIAKMLLKGGKYDQAIEYDQSIEKDVVEHLYKTNQQEEILELDTDSTFLSYEKAVVEFNTDTLMDQVSLIEDKGTLKRLALAFINHEDFESAKNVLERLKNDGTEILSLTDEEMQEVNQYLNKVELEIQLTDLNSQLASLQEDELSLDASDEEQQKRDLDTKDLQDQIADTQKQLIKLDEKLGIDG